MTLVHDARTDAINAVIELWQVMLGNMKIIYITLLLDY